MKETTLETTVHPYGLRSLGLDNLGRTYWDLPTPGLYEEAIRRYEGSLSHLGPLVIRTGQYTGRLPRDKFLVREPSSENKIWWGKINRPMPLEKFDALEHRMCAYLQGKDIFIENCYAGADEKYRIPIRVISERASAALFARTMFIRELDPARLAKHVPEFTVIHAPSFHADPEIDGTHSEAFVLLHFGRKLILIGGTGYAGEIKKSIFTVMNYLLPQQNVMAMHCSANYGKDENDVAIFFGLSGTGKTTLSADPERTLIGDDEHGWSDDGVFNFEGGCYAKVIKLSHEGEPEIYETTRRFGTILENVTMDMGTRHINLDDASLTENTRAAYPITHIPNMTRTGKAGHPRHIIMLTCDAFGVLPPVARLTREQAMYHFLAGYTAKVAGTEAGVKEPQATFSPCFGAPFMALPPTVYAKLLGKKIAGHDVDVWLVNTGWSGGPYGTGQRIKLGFTRAMVKAVLSDSLKKVRTNPDPIFGLAVPQSCPGVPLDILNPRNTWKDKAAYDAKAHELAAMFGKNFAENAGDAPANIKNAGPLVGNGSC
ncbi:MAG TPA: phosphoenolpyruvate carboxykinase (ATP) [Verrucomicrobiae bacterium]|nr:phosphoenolpyruvate carboxykinase (ATP) [Verrucomicrobiae bacterium]